MNEVNNQTGGFINNSIYYGDTDSMNILNKYWSQLVDNGSVGKPLGLFKNIYGNLGIFYGRYPAPKMRFCLVIDDFGNILTERTFKGYSEKHRRIKLNEFIAIALS